MSHHYNNNNNSSYHDDVFRSVPCVAIEAPVNYSLRESYSSETNKKKDSSSSLNHVSTTTPLQQLPTYRAPPPRVISAAATGFTSNHHCDEDEAPIQGDRDDYAATAAAAAAAATLNNPRRLSFLRPLQNTTAASSHYCGGGWGDDFSSSKIQTISNSYYPLLPNHVILQQDNLVCLPRLLARLTNCFRRLSLQATYNHRPTLSATLYSIEGVELFVSLLQRRQCSKEDSTMIIVVQVQHICGDDSSYFHNYANKILSACLSSRSGEYDMMEDDDNITTTTTPAMVSSRKHVQGLLQMEQQRMCLEDTSDVCQMLGSMFRHEDMTKIYTCTFARHVLLQQLCVLCDASMMSMSNIDCAVYTSRAVLLGGVMIQDDKETCNNSNKIHEFVMSILTSRGSSHVMDGNMLDSSSTRASRDVFLRALLVLSHSLETVRYYDDNDSVTFPSVVEQILQQSNNTARLDLVSLLLKELEHADTRPHEACVSAVCLRNLQTGSADVHEQVLQNLATVDHAIEIGIQHHVKLERQARALRSAVLNNFH